MVTAPADATDVLAGAPTAHRTACVVSIVLAVLAVALFALGVGAASTAALFVEDNSQWAASLFVMAAFCLISAIVAAELWARRRINDACDSDCRDWESALKTVEPPEVRALAIVNFKQLRRYISISQIQARRSFLASVSAATVGLLVLISGALITLDGLNTGSKIVAGVLTSAGAALSGYVARTFLRTYEMASKQMSHYYGQPLVHCYLLQADWIADKICSNFGPEDGLAAWRKALHGALWAARASQSQIFAFNGHLTNDQLCPSQQDDCESEP